MQKKKKGTETRIYWKKLSFTNCHCIVPLWLTKCASPEQKEIHTWWNAEMNWKRKRLAENLYPRVHLSSVAIDALPYVSIFFFKSEYDTLFFKIFCNIKKNFFLNVNKNLFVFAICRYCFAAKVDIIFLFQQNFLPWLTSKVKNKN